MKKYFVLLLMLCCSIVISAQQNYKVSTSQQKKKILIEELTGCTCTYCPSGHKMSFALSKNYPGEIFVVTLHEGPMKNFDLTTEEGNKISDIFHMTGAPSAMLNRRSFDNSGLVYKVSQWPSYVKQLREENAPVNLYIESEYDDETKNLKVHVEGYLTENIEKKELLLNVFTNQDYIVGYQKNVQDPNNYRHMNVLRDYITPLNGDKITVTKKGEYFTADYNYTMPADIKGIDLKPQDTHIVAFVTYDNMSDVLNVTGCQPVIKNFKRVPSAEFYAPDIPVNNKYCFKFFEGTIKNNTSEHVTKATFEVTTNDKKETVTIDCDIEPYRLAKVEVPCNYEYNEKGFVQYEVKLTGLNDNNIEPRSLSGRFLRPNITKGNVKANITTDKHASIHKFVLKDENGKLVKEFGPYEDGLSQSYEEEFILEKEMGYCFEVSNEYGDGMMNGAKGSFVTTDESDKTIEQVFKITYFGARSFFILDKTLKIDDVKVEGNGDNRVFSLSGVQFDGNNKSEKIVITNGRKLIRK